MHNHGDVQWPNYGACIVNSSSCIGNRDGAAMERIYTTIRAITHVFTQIILENTCHIHTIIFHHGYRGMGPYFRQAEDRGRHIPVYYVIS